MTFELICCLCLIWLNYVLLTDLHLMDRRCCAKCDPLRTVGVFRNGRLVLFYSYSADIGDGLEDPDVHGDPAEVREAATKMAVNILMYALTHP